MNNSEIIIDVLHSSFYEQITKISPAKNTGIYILRKYNSKGVITPIPRLIKLDTEGILYIGKSDDLTRRLGVLVNLINGTTKTGKHSMGRRFQEVSILKQHIKPENLKLHITIIDKPRELESKLLDKYLNEFGELPPLNNSR